MRTYFVYKIININGDVYYGSTCMKSIKRRVQYHRCYGNCCCNYFDWDNVTYEEVELLWADRAGARFIEQYYIDNFPCINNMRSHRTEEYICRRNYERQIEYRKRNREHVNEHQREYRKRRKLMNQCN